MTDCLQNAYVYQLSGMANLKRIQAIRVEFLAKIVKRSGPNKSDQEEKSLKIVKRSGSSNRHLRVLQDNLE